ncbi:DUF1566 domain-containing protein [Marinimicrobium locisalis]|uniref:Lcl C-terminal domain-containing protein n=1 Tax=Marinimicrobium locisalis TaxID=546022 RepID=UPI0032216A79
MRWSASNKIALTTIVVLAGLYLVFESGEEPEQTGFSQGSDTSSLPALREAPGELSSSSRPLPLEQPSKRGGVSSRGEDTSSHDFPGPHEEKPSRREIAGSNNEPGAQPTISPEEDSSLPSDEKPRHEKQTNNPPDRENDQPPVRFVKLDRVGAELPIDATEWSCVLDKSTGLVWEVKTAEPGLHFGGNRVSWYMPQLNQSGIYAGEPEPEDGTCHRLSSQSDDKGPEFNACNTHGYTWHVNGSGLCGHSDWRLPSPGELRSIVHTEHKHPAIATQYFPHTQNDYYWTSSTYAYDDRSTWSIHFRVGNDNDKKKKLGQYVRLVRGEQTLSNGSVAN